MLWAAPELSSSRENDTLHAGFFGLIIVGAFNQYLDLGLCLGLAEPERLLQSNVDICNTGGKQLAVLGYIPSSWLLAGVHMYILIVWSWLQALGNVVECPAVFPKILTTLGFAAMHLIIPGAFNQHLEVCEWLALSNMSG